MPSRNNALNASPVARRLANTTGSAELGTSDIRNSVPALLIRQTGATCKGVYFRLAGTMRRSCKPRATPSVSERDVKKEPLQSGSLSFHREASNRVDRSHSRPEAGQIDNGRETLING